MPPTEPTLKSGARPEVSGASHPAAEPASAPLTPADDAEAEILVDRDEFESLQRALDQAL